jgi:hypothetical protein
MKATVSRKWKFALGCGIEMSVALVLGACPPAFQEQAPSAGIRYVTVRN